jgi:hypothetical protein
VKAPIVCTPTKSLTHVQAESMQTVIPEGVVLSLTAIVASLLIGELHRTGSVLVTSPKWVGVLVNVLRSATIGLFISALVSVLAVCIVAALVSAFLHRLAPTGTEYCTWLPAERSRSELARRVPR